MYEYLHLNKISPDSASYKVSDQLVGIQENLHVRVWLRFKAVCVSELSDQSLSFTLGEMFNSFGYPKSTR